jgi:Myb-like DNA-binding domain
MAPRPFERGRTPNAKDVSKSPPSSSSPATVKTSPQDKIQHIIAARVKQVQSIEQGPPALLETLQRELGQRLDGIQWASKTATMTMATALPKDIHVALCDHYQRVYDPNLTREERQISMNVIVAINKSIEKVLETSNQHHTTNAAISSDSTPPAATVKKKMFVEKNNTPSQRRAFGTLNANTVASRAKFSTGLYSKSQPSSVKKSTPSFSRKIALPKIKPPPLCSSPKSPPKSPPKENKSDFSVFHNDDTPRRYNGSKTPRPSVLKQKKMDQSARSIDVAKSQLSARFARGLPSRWDLKLTDGEDVVRSIQTWKSNGSTSLHPARRPQLPTFPRQAGELTRLGSVPSRHAPTKRYRNDPWGELTNISFSPLKKPRPLPLGPPLNRRAPKVIDLTTDDSKTMALANVALKNVVDVCTTTGDSSADSKKKVREHGMLDSSQYPGTTTSATVNNMTKIFHWTEEDDDILRSGVDRFGDKGNDSWASISETFFCGRRTALACQIRWHQQLQQAAKKRKWEPRENAIVIEMTKKGTKSLEMEKLLPERSSKQIQERYSNHLDPCSNTSPWTEEDDNSLVDMQQKLGNQWAQIGKALSGRSALQVKNRFYSKQRSQSTTMEKRGNFSPLVSTLAEAPDCENVTEV